MRGAPGRGARGASRRHPRRARPRSIAAAGQRSGARASPQRGLVPPRGVRRARRRRGGVRWDLVAPAPATSPARDAASAAGDGPRAGASPTAARTPSQAIVEAILAANDAVVQVEWTTRTQRVDPSCTLVSALCRGGEITVGWVGDSRAYWFDADDAAPAHGRRLVRRGERSPRAS